MPRYFPPKLISSPLAHVSPVFQSECVGHSVNNLPITLLKFGFGSERVLMWSQMHGNESTTTRAVCDLLSWLPKQKQLQKEITLYIIPQLNPDGAQAYTRTNAAGVDLNRDAAALSQPESKVLHRVFNTFQPHYCFNLHDQRTFYGVGDMGVPASLSFLAPAANAARTVTTARAKAMQLIAAIKNTFDDDFQRRIGRYDDTFNPHCVGDTFAAQGVITLLFEAGHFPNDYERNHTRTYVLKALKEALKAIAYKTYTTYAVEYYFAIPENTKSFVDIIINDVTLMTEGKIHYDQQLALQFVEKLNKNKICFVPQFVDFGSALSLDAHQELEGLLLLDKFPILFEKEGVATDLFEKEFFELSSF